MRRAQIEQNRYLLKRLRDFRIAADIAADALAAYPEVQAIAVIGSVAKAPWKEVPRFREFRRRGIELWHECSDLDLAVWIDSMERLGAIRRTRDTALRNAYEAGTNPGVTGHQVEIFLIEPKTDRYLGRLCNYAQCPKGKPDCLVEGCGAIPFNKQVAGFEPDADLLAPIRNSMLYERGAGKLRSALSLPDAACP